MPETALIDLLVHGLRKFWAYGALFAVSVLAWHLQTRAVANAAAVRVQAAQFRQAQAAAAAIAQRALKHQEVTWQAKAMEADNAYHAQLADARSAADRYIAAYRVRAQAFGGDAGAATARAADSGAVVPAAMPADAVMVSANDVQSCTNAVTYAIKARDWANQLNR